MWVTVLSEMLALVPSEIMVKGKIYLQACLFSNSVEPAQMFTINVNINLFSDSKKKKSDCMVTKAQNKGYLMPFKKGTLVRNKRQFSSTNALDCPCQ